MSFLPRYRLGQTLRVWKPGYAEHGARGVVSRIEPYDGPPGLARWQYRAREGWKWFAPADAENGVPGFAGSLGEYLVLENIEWWAAEERRRL